MFKFHLIAPVLISIWIICQVLLIDGLGEVEAKIVSVASDNKTQGYRNSSNFFMLQQAVRVWYTRYQINCADHLILRKIIDHGNNITACGFIAQKDLKRKFMFQAQSITLSKLFFWATVGLKKRYIQLPPSNSLQDLLFVILHYHFRPFGDTRRLNHSLR